MNGRREALGAARRALAALAGGTAPRVFRRRLARVAGMGEPAGDLRRATAWLRELAAVRPRLLAGPLFGGVLAELTGGERPAGEAARLEPRRGAAPAGEAARPGRRPEGISPSPAAPAGKPAPPVGRSRPDMAAPATPSAGRERAGTALREPAAPLALAPRANQELLERLSRRSSPLSARNGSAEPAPQPRPFPVPGRNDAPVPAPDVAAEARWRRDLAARAEPATRTEGGANVSVSRARTGNGRPEGAAAAAAENPWQIPLTGPRAPREVLARFRSAGRPVRPAAPAPPTRREPAAPGTGVGPWGRDTNQPGSAAPAGPGRRPGLLRDDGPAGPEQGSRTGTLPTAASRSAGRPASPQQAADLAAETAPLLVPPPSLPPFLAVHAATEVALRRPAAEGPTGPGIPPRVPAVLPDDDLAARLDRLLAEEARRHGIDV